MTSLFCEKGLRIRGGKVTKISYARHDKGANTSKRREGANTFKRREGANTSKRQ